MAQCKYKFKVKGQEQSLTMEEIQNGYQRLESLYELEREDNNILRDKLAKKSEDLKNAAIVMNTIIDVSQLLIKPYSNSLK